MRRRHHPLGGWMTTLTLGWLVLSSEVGAALCPPFQLYWEDFVTRLLTDDGRVVDHDTHDMRSTSEGQAYGLFIALVRNDRERFDRILQWTQNNLARGDLARHLPAWRWGKAGDGRWRVIDPNPASDADVWLAYTLLEAGRLWDVPEYQRLGRRLASHILQQETVHLPGLGRVLLPAPWGFRNRDGSVRINPSYLVIQLFRRLAQLTGHSGWKELVNSSHRILLSMPGGLQADWLTITREGRMRIDDNAEPIGSYAAIRVYLWAGMLHPADPLQPTLLAHLAPLADVIARHGALPESIDTRTGKASGHAPRVLAAALLPFLNALGRHELVIRQCQVIQADDSLAAAGYYSRMLSLFGLGWQEGLYQFAADGRLLPSWAGS